MNDEPDKTQSGGSQRDTASPAGSPWTDEESMSAGYLLWQVARHSRTIVEEVLAPLSLRARHLGMMMWLSREGPMSQQQLAGLAGVDPSSMVSIVDEMERMRLAVRRRNPEDRRAYLVEISPHGRDVLAQGKLLMVKFEDRLLAGLDAAERATLISLLRRILETS